MFKKISDKMNDLPRWAAPGTRQRRLQILDRLLDGTFYDHLPNGFYDERQPFSDIPIPLEDRRPSSQYRLPRMIARWSARKLWSGRHAPRIRHKSQDAQDGIEQLIQTTQLWMTMMNATVYGSVGSVAVSFCVVDGVPALSVWRSQNCSPTFDRLCKLRALRVHYLVDYEGMMALSAEIGTAPTQDVLRPGGKYWYVRDITDQDELTYEPVRDSDWNPTTGFQQPGDSFLPWEVVRHGHGFVPAVWFCNISGGERPDGIDGACTWEDAIPNSIEIDYLLSQMSRGTRYNCAPTLAVTGEVLNQQGDVLTRSASDYIELARSMKDSDGTTYGAGSATLLEMTGTGLQAALEHIRVLRNLAIEAIGGSRKDPEKVKGAMSARAMEFTEEDAFDLVMELRSSYGSGCLELLRKMVRALGMSVRPDQITLGWPKLYQPTNEELAHLIAGLVQAATPIVEPTQNNPPNDTTGGRPQTRPQTGRVIGPLLTLEEASTFLKINMDLDNIVGTDDSGVPDDDRPTESRPHPAGTEPDAESTVRVT